MTKSETMLWWELRDHQLGAHFRRQLPLGPYTADFACHQFRLIVEIDGRTHSDPEATERDSVRQKWLEREGWQVLRFSDDLIYGGLPLVVDAIKAACRSERDIAPTPLP
jgi:very-short-patch-repair endonuclease